MKRLLIAALAALPIMAQAKPIDVPTNCRGVYFIAQAIMELRQMGMDMPVMIEITAHHKGLQSIALEAYKERRYRTAAFQEKLAREFAEDYYNACYEINGAKEF